MRVTRNRIPEEVLKGDLSLKIEKIPILG